MRRVFTLMMMVCALVFNARAHELTLSDTLRNERTELLTLLRSRDFLNKANLLNQWYSPVFHQQLKSSSTSLILDSIVITAISDESGLMENSELYTCTIENEGKNVVVDIFEWNTTSKDWKIADQNYYEFDENGKLARIEYQEYINREYRLYTRIDYAYENDLLKFESRYDRVDEIEKWSELEQLEYRYNENKSLKTVYVNDWDTYEKKWMTIAYRVFAYDSIGNIKTETGFVYDYFEDISTKKFELKYWHDSLNNLIEIREYVPGWEGDDFVPERKQENRYSETELKSETFYKWDYDADDWIGQVKKLYSGEAEGKKIFEMSSYLWSTEQRVWQGSQKSVYLSENNYLTSDVRDWDFMEVYMPAFAFEGVVSDKIEHFTWENEGWISAGTNISYFSDETMVGIEDGERWQAKVYPNPCSDILTVHTDDFDETTTVIRDLSGRVILQTHFQNRIQLDLSQLKPGIYFIELISDGGRSYVNKFIKN